MRFNLARFAINGWEPWRCIFNDCFCASLLRGYIGGRLKCSNSLCGCGSVCIQRSSQIEHGCGSFSVLCSIGPPLTQCGIFGSFGVANVYSREHARYRGGGFCLKYRSERSCLLLAILSSTHFCGVHRQARASTRA